MCVEEGLKRSVGGGREGRCVKLCLGVREVMANPWIPQDVLVFDTHVSSGRGRLAVGRRGEDGEGEGKGRDGEVTTLPRQEGRCIFNLKRYLIDVKKLQFVSPLCGA